MFSSLKLTNEGKKIITKVLNGEKIVFTKIVLGSGNKPGNVDNLKNVVKAEQEIAISRSKVLSDTVVSVGGNLLGSKITKSFDWKEIGLFAKDSTNTEVLFSYDNSDTDVINIPVGGIIAEQMIDLNINVGDSSKVQLTINKSLVTYNQQEIDAKLQQVTKTITDINSQVTQSLSQASNDLTNHKQDNNNPHSVTKQQIGLGDVPNQPNATVNEAKAGTSNSATMTPATVRNALEGFGLITDGNIILKVGGNKPTTIPGKTIIWIDINS